jgi:hypothetical protein
MLKSTVGKHFLEDDAASPKEGQSLAHSIKYLARPLNFLPGNLW